MAQDGESGCDEWDDELFIQRLRDPTTAGPRRVFAAVQEYHAKYTSDDASEQYRRIWTWWLHDWMGRSWRAVFGEQHSYPDQETES